MSRYWINEGQSVFKKSREDWLRRSLLGNMAAHSYPSSRYFIMHGPFREDRDLNYICTAAIILLSSRQSDARR